MNTPRQLTLDLVNPPQPSLANFVVGRNAEVVAALRAVAAGAGERFIYIWGESGSGRTHLLQALGFKADAKVPVFDPGTHLYLIDDLQRCPETDQQGLFVLLNEVRSSETVRFIGTGNAAPMHLPLRDDIRTRLAWGLVYQLHALSDVEKAQALTAHAATRGLALSADVVDYLLAHMPRDMRTLVAIVDALDDYALSERRSVTVPLARQWAQQGNRDGAP
ncbi:MAG: DnaA regulatory inactivator Hda [Burkholderiaceae bacterium]|nr:DnaA regulatory inactivator Hda [Burkholderiaceae bacterium]